MMERNGQSTVEYAVVIAVAVAALLAMQIFVKRGVQGKLRAAAEQVGEQYVPGKTKSSFTVVNPQSSRRETLLTTGEFESKLQTDEEQQRTGFEQVDTTGETKLFQ